MSKTRWTLLSLSGLIFILSVNIWAAKRDHKLLESYTQSEQVIYKQIPVIPFSE